MPRRDSLNRSRCRAGRTRQQAVHSPKPIRGGPYAQSARIVFPVSGTDDRLHPKSAVFGAFIAARYVAHSERLLESQGRIEDRLGERQLAIQLQADGSVTIRDRESGESFTPTRLFWFAWLAFHSDTEIRNTGGD